MVLASLRQLSPACLKQLQGENYLIDRDVRPAAQQYKPILLPKVLFNYLCGYCFAFLSRVPCTCYLLHFLLHVCHCTPTPSAIMHDIRSTTAQLHYTV